jgi:hypothetical protein
MRRPPEPAIACTRRQRLVQKLLKTPRRRVSVFVHPVPVSDLMRYCAMLYASPAESGIGLAYKGGETVKGQNEQ